jgi:hypothetical protein
MDRALIGRARCAERPPRRDSLFKQHCPLDLERTEPTTLPAMVLQTFREGE